MKRVCVWLTVLLFLTLLLNAFAETKVPIKYRGFEWNTDSKTVIEQLEESTGRRATQWQSNFNFLNEPNMVIYNWMDAYNINFRLAGAGTVYSIDDISVAGYTANGYMIFLDDVNSDNSINRNDEESLLVKGSYSFSSELYPDYIELFVDLYNALVDVYGDPDVSLNGDYTKLAFWRDGENNKVQLKYNNALTYSDDFEPSLSLAYESGDALERCIVLENIIREEEAKRLQEEQDAAKGDHGSDNINTDGL